ncbi:hypothetical protein VP168E361_P0052 [Vibrio phage 168E36-1]|nr:hypothetical protein VP168E361_P0052 [Vibrio phage 168E36-1]
MLQPGSDYRGDYQAAIKLQYRKQGTLTGCLFYDHHHTLTLSSL